MPKRTVPKWLRVFLPAVLIVIWVTLGAIGGPYFGRIQEVSSVDLTAFLPKSAESTKVNEQIGNFRETDVLPAIIVFETKQGELDQAQIDKLTDAGKTLQSLEAVKGEVAPAIISDDRQAARLIVPISSKADQNEAVASIKSALAKTDTVGTEYKVTGPSGFAADLNKAFEGIDGILLLTALAVVFVILIVVYRSVLLPIIVLLTSIFALSASILVVWWLAKIDIVELNGQVQGILFILVIGAATDYSLLYVARFREGLYHTKSKYEASMMAYRGAFEPIVASGSTVIVGLLCLLLSDLASNKALGPVGAIGIVAAMLGSLTLLPSLLYVFGRASFWPVVPRSDKRSEAAHDAKLKRGFWVKVGNFVASRYRLTWLVSSFVLLVAAMFTVNLKADGVAQSELILGSSEARDGQKILSSHFPGGSGSPALIIIQADQSGELVTKLDALDGVDGVSVVATGVEAGFKPLGSSEEKLRAEIKQSAEKELEAKKQELEAQFAELESTAGPFVADAARTQAMENIPTADEIVVEAYPFKDATPKVYQGKVLLQATLVDAPDSDEAKNTVAQIRETSKSVSRSAIVGGNTAVQLDTTNASIKDRQVILPVVLLAITLILMILLRSVVAPLLLLATTVVSFAASLGVAAILFNDVFRLPGADPSVILYSFVFLVALGIDYNIFLMTRVREETVKAGTATGVINGLVVTGGVITSAGIVLAATFAALGVIPILFLAQLAFIVAFGVLLDTFIVRSLLVPALIKDIGPFVWWPSKLRNKP